MTEIIVFDEKGTPRSINADVFSKGLQIGNVWSSLDTQSLLFGDTLLARLDEKRGTLTPLHRPEVFATAVEKHEVVSELIQFGKEEIAKRCASIDRAIKRIKNPELQGENENDDEYATLLDGKPDIFGKRVYHVNLSKRGNWITSRIRLPNSKVIEAIIDTGSQANLVDKALVAGFSCKKAEPFPVSGIASIPICVKARRFKVDMTHHKKIEVVAGVHPSLRKTTGFGMLLGVDMYRRYFAGRV